VVGLFVMMRLNVDGLMQDLKVWYLLFFDSSVLLVVML